MQLSRTQQISVVYLADYIVTEGTGGDTRKLGQPTLLTKVSDVDTFVRPCRTYTRWSSEDTRIVKNFSQKYITDTETTGSLPPKSVVMLFLSKNEILQGHENK